MSADEVRASTVRSWLSDSTEDQVLALVEDPSLAQWITEEFAALAEQLRELQEAEEKLQWTIIELAAHVHDCEEILSPRTRRTVSEVRAAALARGGTTE